MELVSGKVSCCGPENESTAPAKELHYDQLATQVSFGYFDYF